MKEVFSKLCGNKVACGLEWSQLQGMYYKEENGKVAGGIWW